MKKIISLVLMCLMSVACARAQVEEWRKRALAAEAKPILRSNPKEAHRSNHI